MVDFQVSLLHRTPSKPSLSNSIRSIFLPNEQGNDPREGYLEVASCSE